MILWELPLVLLHQAEHVYLWADGAKLRRPGRMDTQDRRDIARILGI